MLRTCNQGTAAPRHSGQSALRAGPGAAHRAAPHPRSWVVLAVLGLLLGRVTLGRAGPEGDTPARAVLEEGLLRLGRELNAALDADQLVRRFAAALCVAFDYERVGVRLVVRLGKRAYATYVRRAATRYE